MQALTLKIQGLYTSPNPFSGSPDGALTQADDICIDQTNLATSRRGFNLLSNLPLTADRLSRLDFYQGSTDTQGYLMGVWSNGKVGYYNGSSWTAFGAVYNHPDQVLARTRFVQAAKNIYWSTANGIYKLGSVQNDTPRLAGVPSGLDMQLSFTSSASGWFGWNTQGTFTGTTNGNTTLTCPGVLTLPAVSVGNYLSGTGIANGTTVSSLTQPTVAATTTATTTAASTSITVTSATGIAIGQIVQDFSSGATIQSGTTVTNVVSTTVTLSLPAKVTQGSAVGMTFTTPGSITMSQTASGSNSNITITYGLGAQVAYRLVWGYVDANSNTILGAPSQWVSLSNTNGGNGTVSAQSTIPSGITTAYFYQLYRSSQTASGSVTPSDEMQLVFQGNPASSDLTNGYVTISDVLPDSLRGASLYTSPSQQTISQAYAQPPVSKDFCTFNGYAFYANCSTNQTLNLTFLGTGSPSGIQTGDTITIGGATFTADSSQSVSTGHFQVYTSGTPAQNITNTTNSFMQVANQWASSPIYCYLLSGPTNLPGMLSLVSRTQGASVFYATASAHGSAYSPTLPTSGTTVASSNNTYKNGVYVSVQNQYENVPLANLLPLIGSATAQILRIIPLRDYVAVLKEDGVFRIAGSSLSNFQVLAFDYTTQIAAPDSAAVLNNQIWCLSTQGVVAIADTGVQQQSWTNINDKISTLLGAAFNQVQQYATGIAYQTDHKYILAVPSSSGDTGNTQAFTYNVFTSAWTRWTRQIAVGFVCPKSVGSNAANILYLGNESNSKVVFERKSGSYLDFVDEVTLTPTITASSGTSVTLNSVAGIAVGSLLFQDSTHQSVITAVNSLTNVVTVQSTLTWTNGSVQILAPINCAITWKPIVAGNPAYRRQYHEGDVLWEAAQFNTATLGFTTELVSGSQTVSIGGTTNNPWGGFTWGGAQWGSAAIPFNKRFFVPTTTQSASRLNVQLTIAQAWANWAVSGLNLVYEDESQELAA